MRPALIAALMLTSCNGKDDEPSAILGVSETERYQLPGLFAPAYVLRVEHNVPHIFAHNAHDLAKVNGFIAARDRYFVMDLARRLAQGRLSEVLGRDALEMDMEQWGQASKFLVDNFMADADQDMLIEMQAMASGANAYIDEVRAGNLQPPSEYNTLAGILGELEPANLMEDFTARDMAAIAVVVYYETNYETADVRRGYSFDRLGDLYTGEALEDLRTDGVFDDVWFRVDPPNPIASATDWCTTEGGTCITSGPPPQGEATTLSGPRDPGVHLPPGMLDRLLERIERRNERTGRDQTMGWGSNAWAVAGSASTDGRALLAGDYHLGLTIPTLFWRVGSNTEELGGGDRHTVGFTVPGLPVVIGGTNGKVAWSQTQQMADNTDWFVEQVQVEGGEPTAAFFQGDWVPLEKHEETYVVKDIPFLDSVGGTETAAYWTTADGRWIVEIEGREPADGEDHISMQGSPIVPEDTDGDGVITAISFDWAGLDTGASIFRAVGGHGQAKDVWEFRDSLRHYVGMSLNTIAADSNGSILYSGYGGMPCRDNLPRGDDGRWLPGADPTRLLDGTQYGGFTVPMDDDQYPTTNDQGCSVPFEAWPQAVNPPEGYALSANNDPGGISLDNDIWNEPHYIGGPWMEAFRAATIDAVLAEHVDSDTADLQAMAELQGNTDSRVGMTFLPFMLDAIDAARDAADGTPEAGTPEARMAAAYSANAARMDEATARLEAWADNGFRTPSGIQTWYHTPQDGDDADSVGTMIFNAWVSRFFRATLDDERFPGGTFVPTGDTGRTRTMKLILRGRGADNPLALASWNPETEESAFFDQLGTEDIESSDELATLTLVDALDFLESPPTDDGGGFGTAEMDEWKWGIKHHVRFESILGEFLGDSDEFSFLTDMFSITPDTPGLGLEGTEADGLPGFPRPGDNLVVDAANSGFGGNDFDFGSGATSRMIVALGPDGFEAYNMLPGGQSGLNDNPYFADQTKKWLANERTPMHFHVEDVVAAATGRETFVPTGNPGDFE